MFDNNICHLGRSKYVDAIKDTLFELFLLISASKIKSYTVYGWSSGYTKIISFIYNIPLESETYINISL